MSTELSTGLSTTSRGKIVKLITIKTEDRMEHKIAFVVSKHRKLGSANLVIRQMRDCEKAKLSSYSQSLFDSCFKNW